MLTMDKIQDIRSRFFTKGENITQIADKLQLDWKTVQKYVDMTDFNEPAANSITTQRFCPKLEPYKKIIDSWLEGDKQAPRKQRHTAKRVFHRLRKEVSGFNCSYRTVASYYTVKHKEIFKDSSGGFLPLEHRPGETQADFGTADFFENGKGHTGKYLELSFAYSNKGYMQMFYGENMECLLEGLDAIFRHINAVPEEIWFDNTSTIVTKVIRGGDRKITERFDRFREHYRFRAVFTNVGEAHEKGNVENKVGYQRRNMLVPVPHIQNLADLNRQLIADCEDDAKRDHYRRNDTIEGLFVEDLKHCHPLPGIKFDLSCRTSATTNNWGVFYLYKGMHEYSVSPKHSNVSVNLKLTSSLVIVMDDNYREIVRHRRLYGDTKQQSMDWLPYLRQLSIRPRALKYSGIYNIMPSAMKQFIEGCSNTETGKVLKVLAELTDRTGFDSALDTINQALLYGAADADSLRNLYRRIHADVPELPAMPIDAGIPNVSRMKADLVSYDVLLGKGVQ